VETRYVPDAAAMWLVYDFGPLVLALPSEFRAAADAIAALAPADGSSPGVGGVLAALEASGVAAGAPFAVLEAAAGGLHVALRGPATVAAGPETLTGLGSEPWLERILPSVAIARLTVPGGEWTFSLAVASGTPALLPPFENSEITAFPDVEASLPLVPPPPPLGLPDEEDRTVLVSDLPVTPAVPAPPPTPAEEKADDKTVVVDDIVKLRAKRSAGLAEPVRAPQPAAPAAAAPVPPARSLSLELPDGSRQPLDAVVLVGRAPSAPAGAAASRLVRLEGDGDISRNHARVAVEGGTVVVTDLGSRNGTIVRVPGRPAQKLREGEPTPVLVDTVIDFGGGIHVSVREG
jgi:hypothetical protein